MYGFDYSVIKDIALREPLVDTVELKATVTNPWRFKVRKRQRDVPPGIETLVAVHRSPYSQEGRSHVRRPVRADCYSQRLLVSSLLPENVVVEGLRRHSCLPGVVRYYLQVYAQESQLFDRSPREIHPLEVRLLLDCHAWSEALTYGSCQRQTVFYTPSTVTISEGQKIRGRLACAPNTKNNRDLDITISYETEEAGKMVVEYKMCVVFPSFCAAFRRLVNFADRWLGVDYIFMFMLFCCNVLLVVPAR